MRKKAIESARLLVDELKLEGQLTPEDFLQQREAELDELFPTSQLLPGVCPLIPVTVHDLRPCTCTECASRSAWRYDGQPFRARPACAGLKELHDTWL